MMVNNYSVYLFDWDGCLADTLSIWLRAHKETNKMFDLYLNSDREVVELLFGVGSDGVRRLGIDPVQYYDALNSIVKDRLIKPNLNEGALPLLHSLHKQGKKIAVVSTSNRSILEIATENNEISEYIDCIIGADDVTHKKPNPEPLILALEKLGHKELESVVMVGDSDKDIMAANILGCDSILYYPKSNTVFYKESYQESLPYTIKIGSFDDFL